MGTPAQLPPDFFDKSGRISTVSAPADLPSDFFDKQDAGAAKTPQAGTDPSDPSFLRGFLQQGLGIAKGAGRTALNLSDIGAAVSTFGAAPYLRDKIPGMKQGREIVERSLQPKNRNEEIGGDIETGFELLAPVGVAAGAAARGTRLATGLKSARGLALGLGAGSLAYSVAQSLLPDWLHWMAEPLAIAAAIKTGGKFSPEAAAKINETFERGGLRGTLANWLGTPVKEDEALKFYEETHGSPPKTAREKLDARVEAQAYKQGAVRDLMDARKAALQAKERNLLPGGAKADRYGTQGVTINEEGTGGAAGGFDTRGLPKIRVKPPGGYTGTTFSEGASLLSKPKTVTEPAIKVKPAAGPTPKTPEQPTEEQIRRLQNWGQRRSKPAAPAAPAAQPKVSAVQEQIAEPVAAGTPIVNRTVDPREISFNRLSAQAQSKTLKMAQRFIRHGFTPEQIGAMSESDMNKQLVAEKFRPFYGKGLSRTFDAGKADIVIAMKKLLGG